MRSSGDFWARAIADPAAVIAYGFSIKANLIGLTAEQRDTILDVLHDPPAELTELRAALARDHRERQ